MIQMVWFNAYAAIWKSAVVFKDNTTTATLTTIKCLKRSNYRGVVYDRKSMQTIESKMHNWINWIICENSIREE